VKPFSALNPEFSVILSFLFNNLIHINLMRTPLILLILDFYPDSHFSRSNLDNPVEGNRWTSHVFTVCILNSEQIHSSLT